MWAAQLAILLSFAALPGELPIGVAKVDVTPDYPVRLNGFGFRRDESAGVRQPIFVRAIAFGGDEPPGPAVVVVAETLGIPDSLHQEIARELASQGVRPERLALLATHTHTAPMIENVAPTLFGEPIPEAHQRHIQRYTQELTAAIVRAAREALGTRRPGRIQFGRGVTTFARNRRSADGPVDHQLPVLFVLDDANQVRAVWTTYACHCVTLSENLIGGDWAGYAAQEIERAHPGCVALVSIGCGADANPDSGVAGARADLARLQGLEIAAEVERLAATPLSSLPAPIVAAEEVLQLPLAPLPSVAAWEQLATREDAVGFHARTQIGRIQRGEPLMTEVTYPVRTWSFGDQLAMAFLPGEVVVDYSVRLHEELRGERLWIHGYANHCPGYVPSERILREGGYEGGGAMVYYDIPGPYAAGLEDKIVGAVKRLLPNFVREDQASRTQGVPPLSGDAALGSFQLPQDLAIELVASEPLVRSPVAIAFGMQGELWVAEMYDYPAGVDGQYRPDGRVVRLYDDNQDGHYDRSVPFLEQIPFPTGVTVWRDGVLICAAPDILFARDADGDGRAEDVRRLCHGFGTDNYQARVNSLEYGLDGWVYGSCGLFGGEIELSQGMRVALGDRDFRLRPDDGAFEPATGCTQQGRVRDDWGNWFGCENGNLLFHYPLDDHQIRRNPFWHPRQTRQDLLLDTAAIRLYPISEPVLFKLSGPAGLPTSGCGLGLYRDRLLGDEYYHNSFTCEPVNNLVARRVIVPSGSTFQAERAATESDREFLASRDPWFRPVQVRTGPDGALWIVDMYRYVIEHPRWIPEETLQSLDTRAGANLGRIYRIVPRHRSLRNEVPLEAESAERLCARLVTENGTLRDLICQRLLWDEELRRPEVQAKLDALLAESVAAPTRLAAMMLLAEGQWLSAEKIEACLRDRDAHVRRQAVRIAGEWHRRTSGLAEAIIAASYDRDPTVRREAFYGLRDVTDQRAAERLAVVIASGDEDQLLMAAAISAIHPGNLAQLVSALPSDDREDVPREGVMVCARMAAASGMMPVVERMLAMARDDFAAQRVQRAMAILKSLYDGRLMRERDEASTRESRGLEHSEEVTRLWQTLLDRCRTTAHDTSAPPELRVSAVEILGCDLAIQFHPEHAQDVARLLSVQEPLPLQEAVVQSISLAESPVAAATLIHAYAQVSPATRELIVSQLLVRREWSKLLVTELANGNISASELSVPQRDHLLHHPDASIRQQALGLFATDASASHHELIDRYGRSAPEHGDPSAGQKVFQEHCANCHRVAEIGQGIGPDIVSFGNKPRVALIAAVLDPSQAVDPRYVSYHVALQDGRVLTGMISEETSTGLTLADPQGKLHPILRKQIEDLQSTGRSLMPEGLEKSVSPESVAHLHAWLQEVGARIAEMP